MIEFPGIETENDRDRVIEFEAIVNGHSLRCRVSYRVLNELFDAENSDPLFAFMMARPEIEEKIGLIVGKGPLDYSSFLTLDTHDFEGGRENA